MLTFFGEALASGRFFLDRCVDISDVDAGAIVGQIRWPQSTTAHIL